MIQRESIFVNGEVVGVIRKDDFSGLIAFSPTQPPSKLPDHEYSDVDELKQAVFAAYQKESPMGSTSGPSNPLAGIFDYGKPATNG